jgi:putative FmdB family regulatory protein
MPTYDYKCNACSHTFEHFQSMKDKPLKKCPECGKNALERLIGTGAAVIFKGSGFYQTDYRSDAYRKSAEADKKPAETPASTDKSKSNAAAAPKTDGSAKSDGPAKSNGSSKPELAKKPEPAKPSAETRHRKSGGKKGG